MNWLLRRGIVTITCLLFLYSGNAFAAYVADITYDFVYNGGNNYTFELTISNTSTDDDTGALDFFLINLDADLNYNSYYSTIGWDNDLGWFVYADEPDGAFGGLPGFVMADDSFLGSGGGGIAQGDSLSGFSFSFNYTGALNATEQAFSFLAQFGTFEDPLFGYDYLGEYMGNLRYAPASPPANPVPEPASLALLSLGIFSLIILKRWSPIDGSTSHNSLN